MYEPVAWVVGEGEAEPGVDVGLVIGVGVAEDLDKVPKCRDHGCDLLSVHPARCSGGPQFSLGSGAPGVGLGDPWPDHSGVAACVERGLVLGDLGVGLDDAGPCRAGLGAGAVLTVGGEFVNGGFQGGGGERGGQPVVERAGEVGFAQVDHLGMVDLVGEGVFGGEAAAVVGLAVVPVAGHPPVADSAPQQPAQGVAPWCAARGVLGRAGAAPGQDLLGLLKPLLADDRRVGDLLGVDPFGGRVPAHLGHVAERDVADVDQHFLFALAVPDLAAGVAGVGQDDPDGALGPGDAAAVPVTARITGRGAGDTVAGQPFGDGEDPPPGEELGEDPLHHGSGLFVDGQDMEPFTVGGLGRVGVRPGVDEQVPVRRAAAQEPALGLGEGGHGGADPGFDPVPLAFAEAAERRHDHVVGFVDRIDRPADFRHPQLHMPMLEQRERVAELVAVERPLRFADHHRVEPPVGVGQLGQQPACLRAARGRDRP